MNFSDVKRIQIPEGDVARIAVDGNDIWRDSFTWDEIFTAINDGTYTTILKTHDCVPLDLGSEGAIEMEIVAFDTDDLADGSGKAPITWVSKQLLKTEKRMNPTLVKFYDYKEQPASYNIYNNATYNRTIIQFRDYIQAGEVAEITNTINLTADDTLTIAYCGVNSEYGNLEVIVNGETIVSDYSDTTEGTYTIDAVSGDAVTIIGRFTSVQPTGSRPHLDFICSTTKFQITNTCNNVQSRYISGYEDATGSIGGWEKCEIRSYLKETIKPMIPEAVRNSIKEVTKTQTAINAEGASFTQTTIDDVWIPSEVELQNQYAETFQPIELLKNIVGETKYSYWWLRDYDDTSDFNIISDRPSFSYSDAEMEQGIALSFCT